MNATNHRTQNFFAQLPGWLRQRRKWVWPVIILSLVFLSAGAPRIKMNMSMEANFMSDDPALDLYNQFKATFSSDEAIYLAYRAKDGDVLSAASLKALLALHQELSRKISTPTEGPFKHFTEVTSLINASYLESQGDLLNSRDLVGERLPQNEAARERLRQEILTHPDFPGFLMSRDSQYGALILKTDLGGERIGGGPIVEGFEDSFSGSGFDLDTPDLTSPSSTPAGPIRFKEVEMGDYADVNRALGQVFEQPAYQSALEFHPVGNAVLMGFFNDVLIPQLNYIFAALIGLMLAMLWLLFRSWAAVIWPVLIVVLANFAAVGTVGWLQIEQSMMLEVMSVLILVIGLANSVHILSGYLFHRRAGLDHPGALAETMRRVGPPCILASFTTALGMFSLTLVPVRMLRNFGLTAVGGISIALVLSLVMLPMLIDLWAPVKKDRATPASRLGLVDRFLDYMEPLVLHHPRYTLLAFGVVTLVALGGFTQIKIDSNLLEVIKDGYPVKEGFRIVDQAMGGSDSLEIYLNFHENDALKDPQVLAAMDRVQRQLKAQYPQVVQTNSLVEVAKYSFQVLNEGRPEFYRLPSDQNTLAQVLFLFDGSNREDRLELVPDDYSQGRINLRMVNGGSDFYSQFLPEAEKLTALEFSALKERYPKLRIELTGAVALTMTMVDRFAWSQIKSFSLALGSITLVMLLLFKSLRVGLIAMIPNLFPVVTTFGLMGYMGVPLDADTLIIAPVVIGIAVDDTIHFLSHYKREAIELRGDMDRAVLGSMREVGQAMSFTSLILAVGFSSMIFLGHTGMSAFGSLSAQAMGAALLADLLMLPALVRVANLNFQKKVSR
ncbi:MAG: MMPL family transporter [bacterium]|nr:MMPL family transporter [bacterium]